MEFDKRDPKKFYCPKCGSRKIKQIFTEVFFVKDNKGKNNIRCACGG